MSMKLFERDNDPIPYANKSMKLFQMEEHSHPCDLETYITIAKDADEARQKFEEWVRNSYFKKDANEIIRKTQHLKFTEVASTVLHITQSFD